MQQERFTDIFIRRPVLATVVSLVILLMGLFSFHKLPLREYPMLDSNIINIEIDYPGANPDLVESFITTPVENSLMGIDGIDYITSTSSQGETNISINFNLGYDLNKANTDVSNAVSSVRYQLPQGILDPTISKANPNSNPVQFVSFSSDLLSEGAVGDYLMRSVKPLFANLPDVGFVRIWSNTYAMRLWLDPQKMAAKNISALDISNAVSNNNVQSAMGQLQAIYQLFNIIGNTDLQTAAQFDNLPVKVIKNNFIRLKDVGQAELGSQGYNIAAFINDLRTSVIAIIPSANGNPLTVSAGVYNLLPEIQKHLPAGLTAKSVWDTSKFIRASLTEVMETLLISVIAVICVIFIFLGSWRSVFIPIVTIPLSLFGVATVMLLLGYTLNTLTFLKEDNTIPKE